MGKQGAFNKTPARIEPLSITKVALWKRATFRSMAAKVTSLIEVKFFSFEEWILEKILTGGLFLSGHRILSHGILFQRQLGCTF